MAAEANPREELITVFDTTNESEAMIVRGLLESSGIESLITSPEAPQDILPGVGNTVIMVRAEQAAEAEEIIAAYRENGEALADSSVSGETA